MINQIMESKRIKPYIDIVLNFFAVGISLGILEIVIFPLMGKHLTPEAYGQMQTIISIIYLSGATMGQALSTTRLVKDSEYKSRNLSGDYNYILVLSMPIVIITTLAVCKLFFNSLEADSIILVLLFATLICLESYFEVGFRLNLNYKEILICRLISCIGYFIGFLQFLFFQNWQWVFIISYLMQLIYCIKKNNLILESFRKTCLFKETMQSYIALNIASLLSKSLTYFDKLILYPMLGGTAVSIYFTANLMGKLVLKVLEPINNVILSYISQRNKVSRNLWIKALTLGIVASMMAYIICLVISRPVLTFFYPQWASAALSLIPLTTCTLCISALTSVLYPFSLKIINNFYQCVINGMCLLVYIICMYVLVNKYKLLGGCIALLISYITKLFIMVYLCFKNINK